MIFCSIACMHFYERMFLFTGTVDTFSKNHSSLFYFALYLVPIFGNTFALASESYSKLSYIVACFLFTG